MPIVSVLPAEPVYASPTATGFTVMVTVAVLEVWPGVSLSLYVNVSMPLKPAFGVYVNEPSALTVSVPWVGPLTIVFLVSPTPRSFASTPVARSGGQRGASELW